MIFKLQQITKNRNICGQYNCKQREKREAHAFNRCVSKVNMGSKSKSSYPLEVNSNKDLHFGNIYINYLMEQLYSSFSLGASFCTWSKHEDQKRSPIRSWPEPTKSTSIKDICLGLLYSNL